MRFTLFLIDHSLVYLILYRKCPPATAVIKKTSSCKTVSKDSFRKEVSDLPLSVYEYGRLPIYYMRVFKIVCLLFCVFEAVCYIMTSFCVWSFNCCRFDNAIV